MPTLSPVLADLLDPVQAADLLQVLEFQAAWEGTRDGAGRPFGQYSMADLKARQASFEAFRVGRDGYFASYRTRTLPEITGCVPGRLMTWCWAVQALLRQAGAVAYPERLVAKGYRMAALIAERTGHPPVERDAETARDAVRAFEAIAGWCAGVKVPRPGAEAEQESG